MLPSSVETQHIADAVAEIDKAFAFIEGMDFDAFVDSDVTVYAVEKAIQNAVESFIRLEGKRQRVDGRNVPSERFVMFFPGYDFEALRRMANTGRHDYGAISHSEIWAELHETLTDIRARAVGILADKRRSLGHD